MGDIARMIGDKQMTPAQKKQLAALSQTFTSMKQLRKERRGANLTVLRKLKDAGLVECRDPHAGTDKFVCEDLEWRATR